jgi:hypothetical protein
MNLEKISKFLKFQIFADFFSSFGGCSDISNFAIFSLNKTCKTHLRPMLPPGVAADLSFFCSNVLFTLIFSSKASWPVYLGRRLSVGDGRVGGGAGGVVVERVVVEPVTRAWRQQHKLLSLTLRR